MNVCMTTFFSVLSSFYMWMFVHLGVWVCVCVYCCHRVHCEWALVLFYVLQRFNIRWYLPSLHLFYSSCLPQCRGYCDQLSAFFVNNMASSVWILACFVDTHSAHTFTKWTQHVGSHFCCLLTLSCAHGGSWLNENQTYLSPFLQHVFLLLWLGPSMLCELESIMQFSWDGWG